MKRSRKNKISTWQNARPKAHEAVKKETIPGLQELAAKSNTSPTQISSANGSFENARSAFGSPNQKKKIPKDSKGTGTLQ